LNALIVAIVVFLSIVLALAGGIGVSYLAVNAVLRSFVHRPQPQPTRLTTAQAGGD